MKTDHATKTTGVIDVLKTRTDLADCEMARPLVFQGKEVGKFHDDDLARYCGISPIIPEDTSLSRKDQAEYVFEYMAEALAACDMEFNDIVRTWLYLDHLLDWYDDFNNVRTAFLREHGVFDRVVPASTGIGIANPNGSALAAGLIAIRPKNNSLTIKEINSPLQPPATDYNSSFSRAIETTTPDSRALYISGTASIGEKGQSVHADDPQLQIHRTMEVVSAILQSRQMTWSDATQGVVYYPDSAHHSLFLKYCGKKNIPELPVSVLEADICRKELLFEIELDCTKSRD